MAKKDKKGKKDSNGGGDPVDAVRATIERALASAGGAAGARDRTRDLIDDFATFAGRFRDSLEELRVIDEVRSLRAELETLAGRVAALESGARSRATAATSGAASRARPTGGGTRRTAAKPGASARAKASSASSPAKRSPASTTAKRPAAAKPRTTAARKRATGSTTRRSGSGSSGSGSSGSGSSS